MFKLLVLFLCTTVLGHRLQCNEKSVLLHLRRPTYHFSVNILDRVSQETNGHFVFSPISTWLQLLALADGAEGRTLNEILRVTRFHRNFCFRKLVRDIFNALDDELTDMSKRRSIIVIDKLVDVKKSFKTNVERLNATKVMSIDFNTIEESANEVNNVIYKDTIFTDGLDVADFNMSVLMMVDTAYMKADWRSPFNPAYTKNETFYSHNGVPRGLVNMMHQTGYFNVTNVPSIGAKALELPFNDRVSMILLLPNKGLAIDIFWMMKGIRLMAIFSLFKSNGEKLVRLKVPRFKVTTDIDNMPDLLNDMGVHSVFDPHANLTNISNYKVFVSAMSSLVDIEVTEKGVSGNIRPEFLTASKSSMDVYFNRPFAYLIVDRVTDVILFAGVYSEPSLY